MSTSSPIIPKRERSPTPPLTTTLEPRTSGVKLVAPLPMACKISSPNYHKSRKQWVWEEIKALNALGLTVTNKFVRDDGLSLEWESPVPVWPDSLKPANFPTPSSSTPQRTAQEDIPMRIEPESMRPISEKELERQATELEDLAIEFLRKYVRTFDTNRAELSGAYAHNALFSYSVHEHTNVPRNSVAEAFTSPSAAAVHRFAPRKGSRNLLHSGSRSPGNLHSGPSEIVKALQSLGPHKFCARSPTELYWNVLALQLGPTARASSSSGPSRSGKSQIAEPFVFLSSHGYLTLVEEKGKGRGTSGEKKLSFDQCFLLQRPHGSKGKGPRDNHDSNAEWPLVAINHQLTVRDLSLKPLLLL